MAARKTVGLSESWRQKIQISMLINRLNDHIFNNKKLEATQLKAIDILLKKVAPDLSQIDSNVKMTGDIIVTIKQISPVKKE